MAFLDDLTHRLNSMPRDQFFALMAVFLGVVLVITAVILW